MPPGYERSGPDAAAAKEPLPSLPLWRARIEPVWARIRSTRAGYPLLDQAIVSLGTFLLGITLARRLAPAEYGSVSILFGVLFLLQIVNTTLVFYPMTVRCSVATPERSRALIRASLLILLPLCLPLCAIIAVVTMMNGRPELALPSIVYFLCWQVQEHCRRALFAEMRFREAILGDAISYVGQTAIIVLLFWRLGSLSLPAMFYVMALTSLVAGLLQARQSRLTLARCDDLAGMWRDFWQIGQYSLVSNVLAVTRFQLLSWTLAIAYGVTATASYQAALNILNVANPIVFALLNMIPQFAAKAHQSGRSKAWEAALSYAALGAPVIFVLYGSGFVDPKLVLWAFYGSSSPYLELDGPVRLLVLAFMAGYATEVICAFLHGIDSPKFAMKINGVGILTSAAVGLPLIFAYDVMGAALATLISAIARLIAGHVILRRMIDETRTDAS